MRYQVIGITEDFFNSDNPTLVPGIYFTDSYPDSCSMEGWWVMDVHEMSSCPHCNDTVSLVSILHDFAQSGL